MPKVSVIIPVYNVENYIERCARSLFEQTLDDIEFIFINDCTPDNSIRILEKVLEDYGHRKNQVKILNFNINQGAAKVREIGMKEATGDFIIHCDSDDWVDKDAYKILYEKAVESNSDMVICDWYETDGKKHTHFKQDISTTDKYALLGGLIKRYISASLWNRLIRRTVIESSCIYYPTNHMMEDVALSIQITFYCKSIIYINIPLYFYFSNSNSICKKNDEETSLKRYNQSCRNVDIVLNFLEEKGLSRRFSNEIVILKNYPRIFIWKLLLEKPKKYHKLWFNTYPEINKKYIKTKGIPFVLKAIFLLTLIGIYPYIYSFIKKYHVLVKN